MPVNIISLKNKYCLLLGLLFPALFISTSRAAENIKCEIAVQQANQQLIKQGGKPVNDEAEVVSVLRSLNKNDLLPSRYVTTGQARKLGWSGKDEDSLWNNWLLNLKAIGGDELIGKSPDSTFSWREADIESVRGFRSHKQLIYSPQTKTRYLSTSDKQSRAEVKPCE
jgi:hypothetical protein